MTDIVKRLREPPFGTETSERNLMSSAADEIERLRADNARLREALQGVMRVMPALPNFARHIVRMEQEYDDARAAARAALAEKGEK